jgi:hypothetical protein
MIIFLYNQKYRGLKSRNKAWIDPLFNPLSQFFLNWGNHPLNPSKKGKELDIFLSLFFLSLSLTSRAHAGRATATAACRALSQEGHRHHIAPCTTHTGMATPWHYAPLCAYVLPPPQRVVPRASLSRHAMPPLCLVVPSAHCYFLHSCFGTIKIGETREERKNEGIFI